MKSYFEKLLYSSKNYLLLAFLLIISLILLSLNTGERIQRFKSISFGIYAVASSLVNGITYPFVSKDEYEKQLQLNAELTLENSLIRSRLNEISNLSKMLEFKERTSFDLIPSRVLSKHGSLFDGRLIVDIGKNDGVSTGMPVISYNGLVGIISLVNDDYSVVKHLYNNELHTAVNILRTNTEGILGWNGSNLTIENVPTTKSIFEGDTIITSSFSTIFPAQIPVGKISRVESSVAGILSEIYIKPFADIESIKSVFVMKQDAEYSFKDSTAQVRK